MLQPRPVRHEPAHLQQVIQVDSSPVDGALAAAGRSGDVGVREVVPLRPPLSVVPEGRSWVLTG